MDTLGLWVFNSQQVIQRVIGLIDLFLSMFSICVSIPQFLQETSSNSNVYYTSHIHTLIFIFVSSAVFASWYLFEVSTDRTSVVMNLCCHGGSTQDSWCIFFWAKRFQQPGNVQRFLFPSVVDTGLCKHPNRTTAFISWCIICTLCAYI